MKARQTLLLASTLCLATCLAATGCQRGGGQLFNPFSANYDRPFPLGQVTDAHWETQQTNAEAADFIFYDHEFVGETAELTPMASEHVMQVALRFNHVPFPVVVEQTPDNQNPRLDGQRRKKVFDQLTVLGVPADEITAGRIVVAPAFPEGITSMEGESAYQSTLGGDFGGGTGRRFGGTGGSYR